MMKLAVLGGSFNPVHIGHLALADAVCVEFGFDKILFVPTAEPPHKKLAPDFASAKDRLAMLRCAVEKNPRFEVSDVEIARGGVSYTFDTLEELSKKYAGQLSAKIALIMGSDLLAGFPLWRNAEQIARMADLILASRQKNAISIVGAEKSLNVPSEKYATVSDLSAEEQENLRKNFAYPHKLLKTPILPVSSTEIRVACERGMSWRYLVPDGVYWYIIKNKLYGVADGLR